MMTNITRVVLAWIALAVTTPYLTCFAQGTLVRKSGQELIEALGKFAARRGEREVAKELAEVGGEVAVRGLAERALREGGEETVETLARLTRTYGADVLRAAENSTKIPSVLKAVGDLPKDAVSPALRRLAAGTEGKSLAKLTTEYGAKALSAEVRHPGVGGQLLQHLGTDGADLAMKLNTNQAIIVARHAEDIAKLAPAQREGVLQLLHNDAERMVAFLGRLTENNPKTVLITASSLTILLANKEAIFGGGTIVYGPNGPYFVPRPGLAERLLQSAVTPVLQGLLWIVAVGAALWITIRLWGIHRLQKIKIAAIEEKNISYNREGSP